MSGVAILHVEIYVFYIEIVIIVVNIEILMDLKYIYGLNMYMHLWTKIYLLNKITKHFTLKHIGMASFLRDADKQYRYRTCRLIRGIH